MIEVWCDGSCNNKTKSNGGVGIVIKNGDDVKLIKEGQFIKTTSARMEIYGLFLALKSIKNKDEKVIIFCDNQYVVNSIVKEWVFVWECEEWRDRTNSDLWKLVLKEYRKFKQGNVTIKWIKGHNGNVYNELADSLAKKAAHRKSIIED